MNSRIGLVVLCLTLSVSIGLVLSRGGPSTAGAARKKPLIGVSLDTLKEERWQKDRDGIVQRATELGAETLVQAANSDDTRQIQDVEALLSRGIGALIIVPHNAAAMAKVVGLAHDAGVPVISYDRLITGADVDLYVTYDPVKIGEAQARFLVEKFRGKGRKKIVRIYGAKTDNNSLLLKKGQDAVLAPALKSGEITVVHEDWADNWKPENAKKIMNAAITRHGTDIDGVLAANDGTAGGAIQALLEEGLAGKVVVTGQDAELAACQRIAAGTQAMTIYKSPVTLGGRAAEAAFRLITGKPVVAPAEVDNGKVRVPSILLEVVTVTKDNLEATVVKDGMHSRQDVFGAAASPR